MKILSCVILNKTILIEYKFFVEKYFYRNLLAVAVVVVVVVVVVQARSANF